MTDIITRLTASAVMTNESSLYWEAAQEIERLRAALQEIAKNSCDMEHEQIAQKTLRWENSDD